jgi:hypothetical protein
VLEQFRAMSSPASNILLARSDLAGLDLIARSCGIGSTLGLTGLRHGLAPGITGFAVNPHERRAQVFDPVLLRYFRAQRLNEVYTVIIPPGCRCVVCDGRRLDRFTADPDSSARPSTTTSRRCWHSMTQRNRITPARILGW